MSRKTVGSLFGFFLGLVGLALLAVILQPFTQVQLFLQHFSTTGRADSFSVAVWSKVTLLLKISAAGFSLLAAALIFRGERMIDHVEHSISLYRAHLRELYQDFGRFLKSNHESLPWVLLLTALGAAFRFKFLLAPMRYDETFNFYYFVKRPFFSIFSDYMLPNNHVLYTAIVRCFYLLFGSAEWVLRMPVFIFGVLVIPAAWVVIALLSGPRVALWATALISSSSYLIEYSSNSRGYMLGMLLGLIVFALGAYVRKKNNRAAWLLIAVLSALGLLTITTMLFEISAVFLWLFFSSFSWDQTRRSDYSRGTFLVQIFRTGLLLVLLTVLFYLPILIFTGVDTLIHNPIMAPMPFDRFLPEVPIFLKNSWLSWNRGYPLALGGLLSCGLVFQFFRPRKNLAFISLLLTALVILFLMRHPPFVRVWIYLLPFYIAGGLGWLALLPRFMDGRIAQISAVILTIVVAYPVVTKSALDFGPPGDSVILQDGKQIAQDLKSLVRPGDMIFSPFPDDMTMLYYLDQTAIKNVLSPEPTSGRIFIVHNLLGEDFPETLAKANSKPWSRYTSPALVKAYEHSRLYETHLLTAE